MLPGEQAGDAAAAADAELVEDAVQMGADSRDFDFKPMRNLLVAEIVGDVRIWRSHPIASRTARSPRSSDNSPKMRASTRLSAAAIYMTDSQPS
jgi:hypothetical protein